MLYDRLPLGGAGRCVNLIAAMKLAGLKDPEPIFVAMEAHEFDYNEKLIHNGDVRHEDSWYQIDVETFLRWITKRNQLDITAAREYARNVEIKLGLMQAEMYNIEALVRSLIKNQIVPGPARPKIRRIRSH